MTSLNFQRLLRETVGARLRAVKAPKATQEEGSILPLPPRPRKRILTAQGPKRGDFQLSSDIANNLQRVVEGFLDSLALGGPMSNIESYRLDEQGITKVVICWDEKAKHWFSGTIAVITHKLNDRQKYKMTLTNRYSVPWWYLRILGKYKRAQKIFTLQFLMHTKSAALQGGLTKLGGHHGRTSSYRNFRKKRAGSLIGQCALN